MIKKVKNFIKEKISGQKKSTLIKSSVTPEQFREAGSAAKKKARELKELGQSLPGHIRVLDGYGALMDYTADEMERFGANYSIDTPLNPNLNFTPTDFLQTLTWTIPDPRQIETSLVTISGVGTSISGSMMPEIKKVARTDDLYFTNPPQSFHQLKLTDELTPLLDQVDPRLSPIWKSAWENLLLERNDSLKNASVNARTVVDEISWKTDYEHLKTLPWCELDMKSKPIRAVRYAWIKYGDTLPSNLKNPKEDIFWKSFGHAYSELNKFIHVSEYDASKRIQVEVPLNALEIGLINYLRDGMTRLLSMKNAKSYK